MAPSASPPTFLNVPAADPASVTAEIAILGIPYGVPYPNAGDSTGCADAPAAIRRRATRLASFVSHHDFDTGSVMLARPERVVDCGDIAGDRSDGPGNAGRAEAAVRTLLEQGAIPLILGGDDSIPIPVLAAYSEHGPLVVLQVDAHLDFRDEVHGVTHGYSSPMRRASEMNHVSRVVQVGLRGVGSARPSDVADARAAGGLLVTARELRERGVASVLAEIPQAASVFISFDLDGLDPSLCPAVSAPAPGGLSWDEAGDLLSGVATRCRVVGAAFTELFPERDPSGYSALVAARLVIRLLSALP